MYFWRIERLKDELRSGPMPQKQQFQYLLAWTLINALLMIPWPESNFYDILSAVIGLVIAALGVSYAYSCNGGSNGTGFLERYYSISFVIAVRFLVFVAPLMIAYYVVLELFFEMAAATTLKDVVLMSVLSSVIYWRIGFHMRQVEQVV